MAKKKNGAENASPTSLVGVHGASRLPRVEVDGYNLELEDENGFLGDRASKKALYALLDKWRKPLAKEGNDPFGDRPSREIGKKELDAILAKGESTEGGLVHAVIEDFAQELAFILRNFLKEKTWKETERIVIGGGLREHRVGELAIGRAAILLKADSVAVDLVPIRNDPDDAGLIGSVQLTPSWIFGGHDSILALDIGGTNVRAGIVELNLKKAPDLSRAAVCEREIWRHADDKPTRDEAVQQIAGLLKKLIRRAEREGHNLAPFIGIGCPGKIESDGSIDRGAQNLPGNWESSRFHLPTEIVSAIPCIADHETEVVMHNDAVVQGLSEVPFMTDVERWGVLTRGTGLGNARFTNRAQPNGKSD
ncbi:MAG: ROK family protein [Alphaproteobacteria bacterium]|nr:ROK family protein [Alphaproteobacteria bacterium]